MPSTILSDNGVSSGSAGLKTTASNDGALALQTTTAGGTATTAVTISTSQNVGIGVTPTVRLQVLGVAGNAAAILGVGTNGDGGIVWRNASNASVGYISVNSDNTDYRTTNDGTGAYLQKPGITFPATQFASSDANTLDDYEEGTWTPTVTFGLASTGITYATQLGRYVKIGRQVTIWVYFLLTSKGSATGAARVAGLPFTNSTGGDAEGASFNPNYWAMANAVTPGGYVQSGQTYFILINTAPATSVSTITDSNFTNTSYLYGCATYTV